MKKIGTDSQSLTAGLRDRAEMLNNNSPRYQQIERGREKERGGGSQVTKNSISRIYTYYRWVKAFFFLQITSKARDINLLFYLRELTSFAAGNRQINPIIRNTKKIKITGNINKRVPRLSSEGSPPPCSSFLLSFSKLKLRLKTNPKKLKRTYSGI